MRSRQDLVKVFSHNLAVYKVFGHEDLAAFLVENNLILLTSWHIFGRQDSHFAKISPLNLAAFLAAKMLDLPRPRQGFFAMFLATDMFILPRSHH